MNVKHLSELFPLAKDSPVRKMVLVNGIDKHSIEAAEEARQLGIVEIIITGDQTIIRQVCDQLNISVENFQIIHTPDENEAASTAVKLINNGEAHLIMKGLISSDKFLRAILDKEFGLMTPGALLSHVSIIDNPSYHKLLLASDVAIIPFPDFKQKVLLVRYLIETANKIGIKYPKVALIAPTEQVLESIPACVDAAKIKQLALDGGFPDAVVDGPMGIDVALDFESATIKKINSEVAGDADCMLFPNVDAGNVFYKVNAKMCRSEQAAIVVGARVPVILSSRGDSVTTKLNSIALAVLMSCKK